MATKSMKVTGLAVQSFTKYNLRGSGLGSNLRNITVTLDTSPPPSAGTATGSVGENSADLRASQSVWDDMNAMLTSFPFKATIHYTGTSTVNDLTFDELEDTSSAIAEDVRVLRKYAEKFATQLLAVRLDEPEIRTVSPEAEAS